MRQPPPSRDIGGQVEAVAGRLLRLGDEMAKAEPSRRREVFRLLVDRIDLRFDRVQHGKRIECPVLSGEIHLRANEGSIFGSVSRGESRFTQPTIAITAADWARAAV